MIGRVEATMTELKNASSCVKPGDLVTRGDSVQVFEVVAVVGRVDHNLACLGNPTMQTWWADERTLSLYAGERPW
jgi:hypothetical protein